MPMKPVMLLMGACLAAVCQAASVASTEFLDNVTLQVLLDRAGFSCSAIDGAWGRKSQVALATYCAVKGIAVPGKVSEARKLLFGSEPVPFTFNVVSAAEHAELVRIPASPEGKAALRTMGYETIQEMYAERGHLSEAALRRLNPSLAWPNPPAGAVVKLPDFRRSAQVESSARANVLRVSLQRREITVFDAAGRLLLLLPCSIAADKDKLPPPGEILVTTMVPKPNYTYTPDFVPRGEKVVKRIFPPGPNCPVGAVWIGLSLPGYGIHGTPKPEQIGRAESHGCFRLANWNARRLYDVCDTGVAVVVEN